MPVRLVTLGAGITGSGVIPIPYPAAVGSSVPGSPFDISAAWAGVAMEDRYASEGPAAWLLLRNDSDSLLLLLWPSSQEPCFLHPGEVMTDPIPRNEDHMGIQIVAQNPFQSHPLQVLTVLGYNRRDIVNGHLLVQSATVNPSVPAAAIGPGPLPASVIAQVLGNGSNPIFTATETPNGPGHFIDILQTELHGTAGTSLAASVILAGTPGVHTLMNEDGTLPTAQLASGALPGGVTIGGGQVTSSVADAQQVDATNANSTTPQLLSNLANVGLSIDNFAAGHVIEVFPANVDGIARGIRLDYRDAGGTLHAGPGVDNTGNLISPGPVGSVGGQATAGTFGVPLPVAQALSVNVTVTTLQTILSYAVTSTGFYRIQGYLRLNNGTSGQKASLSVLYTDPDTGASTGFNLVTPTAVVAVSGIFVPTTFDGNQTLPNGAYATLAAVVHVKAGTTLLCQYQDPLNTPNDSVTFLVERLA